MQVLIQIETELLELFNKFIAQPVYDEEQWKTLAKVGGAG